MPSYSNFSIDHGDTVSLVQQRPKVAGVRPILWQYPLGQSVPSLARISVAIIGAAHPRGDENQVGF